MLIRLTKLIYKMRVKLIVMALLVIFEIASANRTLSSARIKMISRLGAEKTKVDMTKIDTALYYFIKFSRDIEELAHYSPSEKNLALAKFMDIHDELLKQFDGNSKFEGKILKLLMQLLDKSISRSILNNSWATLMSRPFRWG